METLNLQIKFNVCDVILIETTNKIVTPSVGKMDGPASLMSADRVSNFFLLAWVEDGEGWNHRITPTSFEKNEKVIKIQDVEGDQWVFALKE